MFPFFRRVAEAGKAISADNMKKVQAIHNASMGLGATCMGMWESARGMEAALPMNQSHDALRGHIRDALKTAHGVTGDSYYSNGPYIHDVFPGHVIYSHNGETLKRTYKAEQGAAGENPKITLGTHSKVHVAYVDSKSTEACAVLLQVPDGWELASLSEIQEAAGVSITEPAEVNVRESAVFVGSITDIKEAAKKAAETGKATTIPIKIIQPGWGSSAYYSKEMIQKTGPGVFKKGTHMFWNHATADQEAQRPEGDLNDLAAVLTKDAAWQDSGAKGPGLYSEAKVFSDYATQVEEKGPHIGVSINAAIKAHEGEAEGKAGRIADAFVHAFSTDFVTKPGAGGAPIVAMESQRGQTPQPKESSMDDKDVKALQDQNAELTTKNKALETRIAALESGQNRVVAVATVATVLREAGVEFNQRLLERACAEPVMKDGKPDQKWVEEIASDFISESGGRVHGMGRERTASKPTEDEAALASLRESLGGPNGLSEAALAYAVPEVKK